MNNKGKVTLLSVLIVVLMVSVFAISSVNAKSRWWVRQCSDGIDNDGDGYTDWPNDPGCYSRWDRSELGSNECDDGIDNDGDGNIDMNDGGCSSPGDTDETNCGDSVCEGGETSLTCPADCGELDSCSDTDGGNYPFTFGTTSGYYNNNPFSHDDYCVDSSKVMEYFCSGDYEQSSQVSCGTDTYGDNYCSNGSVFHDYYDYFCSLGACDYTITQEWIEECEYGCDGGECMGIPDSCSGTEGPYSNFVVEVFGTVSGYFDEQYYSYDDYCVNGTVLKEYACTGAGYAYSASYDMDCVAMNFTACVNGACI